MAKKTMILFAMVAVIFTSGCATTMHRASYDQTTLKKTTLAKVACVSTVLDDCNAAITE